MEISYLVRGAVLKCMCGSETGKLDLPESHGTYIRNDPVICEDDCEPGINIPSFGICKITNNPCIPVIDGKWLCVHKDTKIGEASAVTTDSALFCSEGSLIVAEESGQKEILELLESLPEEELLTLMNGLKLQVPYSQDPVNLTTGNFVLEKEDISIIGTDPLSLKRTYNSIDKRKGILGSNWTHNHEMYLENFTDRLKILTDDGCIETYHKENESTYNAMPGIFNKVNKTAEFYILVKKNGIIYHFNLDGECVLKIDKNGVRTEYIYQNKRLSIISTKIGKLYFQYNKEGRLASAFDHTGRTVNYFYDEQGMLAEIHNIQGEIYQYKYDADGRLTETYNPSGIRTVKNVFDDLGRTIKQTFADGSHMHYQYDDNEERIVLTEQNGNKIKYYRDEKFRNIRTVYQDGYESYEYNKQNQKIYYRDKNGNEHFYEYDENGNMITYRNPFGHEKKMIYNKQGLLVKHIYFDGTCYQYSYDKNDNLVEEINPADGKISRRYNEKGLLESVCLPDYSELRFQYDDKGNIIKIIEGTGAVREYCYDELNRVIRTVDGNGNQSCYEYNKFGDITKVINAAGEEKSFVYDKNRKVVKIINYDKSEIQQEFNELGKLCKITDEMGNVTKYNYDIMWNICEEINPNGVSTSFLYNKMNQLETVIWGSGLNIKYEYDSNGNMIKKIGPNGETYHFKYNAVNLNTEIEEPNGAKTALAYDSMGRLICMKDALGNETRMEYNELGLKKREIDTLGHTINYYYNTMGLLEKTIGPLGSTTKYEYYPGARLKKEIHPDGSFDQYEYDKNDNIIAQSNQAGYRLTYTYDCMDQLIKICDSYGAEITYTYDSMGRVSTIADSRGNVISYKYSATGNLIEVLDISGNKCEYRYDKLGNITELRQYEMICSKGQAVKKINAHQRERSVVFYNRNPYGQVTSIKDALGNTEYYEYNSFGKISKKTDKEGFKTSYCYNECGDISKINYDDGKSVIFHYNILKQLVRVEDWLGITRIVTDAKGRAREVTDHKDRKTIYEWNSEGGIQSITYPDNAKFKYEYDYCGKVSRLIDDKNKSIQYAYDNNGHLKSVEYPNGLQSAFQYDRRGYVSELNHIYKGQIMDHYSYQYDEMGNKIKIIKNREGLREESGCYQYTYDEMSRLCGVIKDGKSIREYGYDSFGNRSFQKKEQETVLYEYNATNQLIHAKKKDRITDYQYDLRGNLIKIFENKELVSAYEYNVRNKMDKTWNKNGLSASYEYNGLGFRTGKQVGAVCSNNTYKTVYQRPDVNSYTGVIPSPFHADKQIDYIVDLTKEYHNLLMLVEDGVNQKFLWNREAAGAVKEGKTSYYCLDELGSPIRFLYNGIENQTYGYEEFGNPLHQSKKEIQPLGFTGYQYDRETGLNYAQARYYSSEEGRFLQKDMFQGILSKLPTLNQYMYCMQNPLTFVDLQGYWPTWKDIGDGINSFFNSKPWKVVSTVGGIIIGGIETVAGGIGFVASLGLTPVSGGVSLGGAVISAGGVTHGVNSIANGIRDITHMVNGEWDEVGTENYLKDNVYKPAGGAIGEFLGGEKGRQTGESVAGFLFYGVDILLCYGSIKEGFGALNSYTKISITHEIGNYIDGFKRVTDTINMKNEVTALTKILTSIRIGLNAKTVVLDDLVPLISPIFGSLLGPVGDSPSDLVWK